MLVGHALKPNLNKDLITSVLHAVKSYFYANSLCLVAWLTVSKWVFIVNVPERKRSVVENDAGHVGMGKGGPAHTRSVEHNNRSATHIVKPCNITYSTYIMCYIYT